jgi:hypothetical protein
MNRILEKFETPLSVSIFIMGDTGGGERENYWKSILRTMIENFSFFWKYWGMNSGLHTC